MMETCDRCNCATDIENLQRLMKSLNTEKELAIDMCKVSAQTIETLEEELENRENGKQFELFKRRVKEAQYQMQNDYTEAINILEDRLRTVVYDLRMKTDESQKKSDEIVALNAKLQIYQDMQVEYDSLCTRETELKEKCLILETKCFELEAKLERVRPTQDEMERQIEMLTEKWRSGERQMLELQSALERTTEMTNVLKNKEVEARTKVAEAIALVDATLVEKQQVDQQRLLVENECRRLKKELMGLIDEAGNQVAKEADLMKKEYENQIQVITCQMDFLEKDRDKKLSHVVSLQKEISCLESEIEDLKKKTVSVRKFRMLSKQLEQNEAKISLLDNENRCLRESLIQHQQRYEKELTVANSRARNLQLDLDEISSSLHQAVEQCDCLATINEQLISERDASESGKNNMASQIKTLQTNNSLAMQHLQRFVDSHQSIVDKWREEYKLLTAKFRSRLKESRNLFRAEKKLNRKLMKKLESMRTKLEMLSDMENESTPEGNLDLVSQVLNENES